MCCLKGAVATRYQQRIGGKFVADLERQGVQCEPCIRHDRTAVFRYDKKPIGFCTVGPAGIAENLKWPGYIQQLGLLEQHECDAMGLK